MNFGYFGGEMEQIVLDEVRSDGRQRGIGMGVPLSMDSFERIMRVNFANYCVELQSVQAELRKEIEGIHEGMREEFAAQKWRIIKFFTVINTALAVAAYFIVTKL